MINSKIKVSWYLIPKLNFLLKPNRRNCTFSDWSMFCQSKGILPTLIFSQTFEIEVYFFCKSKVLNSQPNIFSVSVGQKSIYVGRYWSIMQVAIFQFSNWCNNRNELVCMFVICDTCIVFQWLLLALAQCTTDQNEQISYSDNKIAKV